MRRVTKRNKERRIKPHGPSRLKPGKSMMGGSGLATVGSRAAREPTVAKPEPPIIDLPGFRRLGPWGLILLSLFLFVTLLILTSHPSHDSYNARASAAPFPQP